MLIGLDLLQIKGQPLDYSLLLDVTLLPRKARNRILPQGQVLKWVI